MTSYAGHSPEHTRPGAPEPSDGKIQGRWMNPPSGPPYLVNVYDDEDFRSIHHKPECEIKCPRDDCDSLLSPKTNKRGTRWLAARAGTSCTHHQVKLRRTPIANGAAGGGGVETAEHWWIKHRIARVCVVMGHDAFVEHYPSFADVFVPGANIALEYQRWDTTFEQRNGARMRVGTDQTIWFFPSIPSDLSSKRDASLAKLFRKRVFQHGGLFINAAHKDDPKRIQKPWDNRNDQEMNRTTRLYVNGSVATYDKLNNALKYAGNYPLHYFLDQVIKGERTLQTALVCVRGVRERRLVWVRHSDLDKIEAVERQIAISRAGRDTRAADEPKKSLVEPDMRVQLPRELDQLSQTQTAPEPAAAHEPAEFLASRYGAARDEALPTTGERSPEAYVLGARNPELMGPHGKEPVTNRRETWWSRAWRRIRRPR